MKKLFAVIFSAIIISVSAFTISGCGCSNQNTNQPATDIVGNWGGRSDDIEAEFNDDGSCIIGGVTGTYKIDENNNLIVTPNSSEETAAEPLTFEYYNGSNTSAIQPNQWTVVDNVLYINGQQYNGVTNATASSNTQGDNSNNSNSQNSSSGVASNQDSSSSSGASSNISDSSSSDNSSSSSSSSSSSTTTPNDSSTPNDSNNTSSSATESLNENEETKMVDIVENIDDF